MAANDPRSIVVFSFDDQLSAQELLISLTRLGTEGSLLLLDAVFVTRNAKGKIRVVQTTDASPGQAAWGGAFWGLLFGVLLAVPVIGLAIGAGSAALAAKLIDTGISDDFVKSLRSSIEPGKVYLAVLVSHVDPEKAIDEAKRYAGLATVVTTTGVSDEAVAELHNALDQDQVQQDVSEEASTIAD